MAFAETEDEARKRLELEFRRIPAPELPAYAATLVRNTPAANRPQTALLAFETTSKVRPAAANSVVAAISKAAPETRASLAAASTRGNDKGNGNGRGDDDERGNGNGNIKPGRPSVHDQPI